MFIKKKGVEHIIKEPTCIIGDSSSCIDLVFTTQPNLCMESGVYASLHSNCHHHIAFAKFNLKFHYPPPYEWEVWHYQNKNKNNIDLLEKFQSLQAHLRTSTDESKENYHSRLSSKLLESKTSTKSYWSISKTFLNNKKILCILPLLHNGKFVMGFKEKAQLFNDFFTKQCYLVDGESKLSSVLNKKTCQSLSTVEFSTYISKIIRNLDPNKAHGHDMISNRMLKICD